MTTIVSGGSHWTRLSAVEELLHYDAPLLTATERFTVEPTEVNGVCIPKGALVYGVIASANHDERVFADPDLLDLGRRRDFAPGDASWSATMQRR